jgi:hypothetical protein
MEAETLFLGGEPVPIGRRAAALLPVLVENAGVPVSKAALLGGALAGVSVEESNLSVQIAALRKAVGRRQLDAVAVPIPDRRSSPHSLPGRGYQGVVEDAKLAVLECSVMGHHDQQLIVPHRKVGAEPRPALWVEEAVPPAVPAMPDIALPRRSPGFFGHDAGGRSLRWTSCS